MDTEFFKELEKFSLMVRKRVSTAHTGSRRSVRYGHGISPVGYREYQKGDDFKLVDWKVYGRTEKLYVREHEEEKSLVVHLLLDSSGSMAYANKFKFASRMAAGFAYLATQENEKFSVSLFGESLQPGEPGRGRKYLLHSVEDLDGTDPKGKTNINRTSSQFERLIRSTSLVVLISDFLDDLDDVVDSIYRLSSHELILIQVLSPEEADLSLKGDVRFVDMESGALLVARVTPRLRDDYRVRLTEHNRRISETCDRVSADFFSFRTDTPIFEAFAQVIQGRKAF